MNPDRDRQINEDVRAALLKEIEDYFLNPVEPTPQAQPKTPERRIRLATAVLLLEMARADLETRHDEHRAAARGLERLLGFAPEEVAALMRLAEDEVKLSVSIHRFTAAIDGTCTLDEKRRVVECLWRVAFSDAEILAHEEYLVRKVAELIHLPFEDFLLAKINAREAFLADD